MPYASVRCGAGFARTTITLHHYQSYLLIVLLMAEPKSALKAFWQEL